jgi:hypothetical protein
MEWRPELGLKAYELPSPPCLATGALSLRERVVRRREAAVRSHFRDNADTGSRDTVDKARIIVAWQALCGATPYPKHP